MLDLKTISAISGATAVLLGAFGEHGLKNRITPQQMQSFKVASNYHLIHSVVALFAAHTNSPFACKLLLSGTFLFSGSIYVLAINGGPKFLGPMTPVGGLLMISGWLSLAF